ncbi:MAG: pyridoxal phosphate-dependent aminotransferase [Candidatus Anammoxibacter sp.]
MKSQINASHLVEGAHYLIRGILRKLDTSKSWAKLHIGDPLEDQIGNEYKVPEHLVKYASTILHKAKYPPSNGYEEVREAIAEHALKMRNIKGITRDDVWVRNGGSESLLFLMMASLNPGDEVLMPSPNYPVNSGYANLLGAQPVFYDIMDNGQPNMDHIKERTSSKTRMIIIINPGNPMGNIIEKESSLQILNHFETRPDVLIVEDATYYKIVFPGYEYTSIASLPHKNTIVVIDSYSKSYLITGWRLGNIIISDPEGHAEHLKNNGLNRLADLFMCANILQLVIPEALNGPQDHIQEFIKSLVEKKDLMYERLSQIPGTKTFEPKAGFYIFTAVDMERYGVQADFDLSANLNDTEGILVVPGSGFDRKDRKYGYLRFVYLAPKDILEKAMDKYQAFLKARDHNKERKINKKQ